MKKFYSNGKLLLSGEYAILDGAEGLALPTKFGQHLSIKDSDTGIINWRSLDETNNVWFTAHLDLESLKVIETSDPVIAHRLSEILNEAKTANPKFLENLKGVYADSILTFPKNWGLGSSSTLINNISKWANIDPYRLLEATFGGSGYDIACAQHNSAIVYSKKQNHPYIKEVTFNPKFKDSIFFIYLNQKKNSREAIDSYRKRAIDKVDLIPQINQITTSILNCNNLPEFEKLMDTHESLISKTLGITTIKEKLFDDYPKSIKSLGAWGGDFVMTTGTMDTMSYFRDKGYTTILPFHEMIL
ncbi:GHMP kinase [Maribacter sp. MMG018]|uniref:GYDIA family GHMP kinase n=1 Tax=Maribacter sp. MMG018 TaxID=2822688 RepID=UPI001B387259|nr:GYDIA family GHMP kinase [Maribacter sp. MMG018]MBQ4912943.1 GHMP kinase [Maribacter sp. MMG018]